MRSGKRKLVAISDLLSPLSLIYDSCLTLVYPQACKICDKSVEFRADGFVCDACWQATHIFNGREIICHKCSAFLKEGPRVSEAFCRRCELDEYDLARAAGLYESGLAAAILNLKHEPFICARLRQQLILAFIDSPFQDATRIIPVPLSARRFKARGFNQASIIARLLARHAEIPIDELSLIRTAHTEKHRAGMDRKARNESVKNAFAVKRPRVVEGENILLVDDVFTSGATVSNCARELKKNGAAKVYVLTIARAF
jgi:ComF family protein